MTDTGTNILKWNHIKCSQPYELFHLDVITITLHNICTDNQKIMLLACNVTFFTVTDTKYNMVNYAINHGGKTHKSSDYKKRLDKCYDKNNGGVNGTETGDVTGVTWYGNFVLVAGQTDR